MSGLGFVTVAVASLTVTAVSVLVASLLLGRRRPLRTGPWVAALVVTVLPALFITIVGVASVLQGEAWPLLGAIGLWALVALTVVNARWAAWAYLASGVAFPLLLAIGALLVSAGESLMIEPANALGTYTVRVIITAALLFWATQRVRHPSLHPRTAIRPS